MKTSNILGIDDAIFNELSKIAHQKADELGLPPRNPLTGIFCGNVIIALARTKGLI